MPLVHPTTTVPVESRGAIAFLLKPTERPLAGIFLNIRISGAVAELTENAAAQSVVVTQIRPFGFSQILLIPRSDRKDRLVTLTNSSASLS